MHTVFRSGAINQLIMNKLSIEISPNFYARIGGVFYLIIIVLGIIGEVFIRGRIVVPGNAMETANHLRAMEFLWRSGIVFELLSTILAVCLGLILYGLTKPVNRDLALLAMCFGLIAVAVGAAYSLQLIEALFPLGNAEYLSAFSPEQLYALASLSIKSHVFGFGISLFLFGPFFLATGYLIFKSGYLPKILGVLYPITGLSYMANGVVLVLAPAFAGRIFMIIAGPAFIGEFSLCLWLLFKGVNIVKWKEWTDQMGG